MRLSTGGLAHLSCATRQAAAAWHRRRGLAQRHLALIAVTLLAVAAWAGPAPGLLVVACAWAALHARFWHSSIRELRRRLRPRSA